MIVTATRGDLRDEFSMADEAFALSPISARATLPGEADYDAISDAFMETSRGRWFLSEYAKRNRNADTRMVLEAVARIEQNIAAEKDATPDDRLPEALATIRDAVQEARAAASQAVGALVAEESLASIRKGAQVIREILARLREIGADGRIYDLIDSQVGAIEAGCGQVASTDVKAALSAAFDLIDRRIEGFGDDDTAQSSAGETPLATIGEQVPDARAAPASLYEDAVKDAATSPPEVIAATAQANTAIPDAETALDDALDVIALEMAALDPAEDDELYAAEQELSRPDVTVRVTESAIAPQPESAPSPQPSLGASLIANGIVRRPDTSVDPLAPVRRMSQAEKIAFFS